MVDEERMRPGHWLGLVLCVPFSSLTLMVGDMKDFWPIKTCSIDPQKFCSGTGGGEASRRIWPTQVHLENGHEMEIVVIEVLSVILAQSCCAVSKVYFLLHFVLGVTEAKCIVCVCVCLSRTAFPHFCSDPDVSWRNGKGFPLVVHHLADLQSVHGFRCCDNIAPNVCVSVSACTRSG